MKSIIFTVTNDLNYDQRMQRICNSLHQAGYDVTLIGRERKNSKPLITQSFHQKRIFCISESGKLFYIEYNIRLFLWLLFSVKADCYSAVDLDTMLPCLFTAKLKGEKIFYDAHEYFTEVPEVVSRPLVKKIWELIEGFSVKRVDRAYTVSKGIAELFEKKYNVQFEVIKNLPHKSIVKVETPQEEYILYQGALNIGRAVDQYIKAMHCVNCKLYLAGEGDLSAELRELTKRENLEHKVKFLGFVPPSDLKRITAQAKIGLNCLENTGLSYYHSLSNKMFDYVMAGIPQIVSPIPECERINNEYEIAIVAGNIQPQTIADTINQLLVDKQLYARLKDNCTKAREVLNWENEEGKLLEIYAGQ